MIIYKWNIKNDIIQLTVGESSEIPPAPRRGSHRPRARGPPRRTWTKNAGLSPTKAVLGTVSPSD